MVSTSEILEFDVLNTVEVLYEFGRFDNLIFTRAGHYNTLKELINQKEVKFGHGGEGTAKEPGIEFEPGGFFG